MKHSKPSPQSRRRFIQRGLYTAGVLGAGSALAVWSRHRAGAAAARQTNPYAYDISRHQKTDPKLVHYEEIKRFRCPHPDARRLKCGPDGRLYVAAGKYASILDLDGKLMAEKALSTAARSVAVAQDGTLYVSVRDHLEVFAPGASRSTAWDSLGKRAWITGLAVGKNEVFAADAGNRVIVRYDRSGKLLGQIGKRDRSRRITGLILPSPFLDVELHSDGLLRVNNPGRHRVETYTPDGRLELSWGKASAAVDGFCGCCNPINLALLADGRVITCEKGIPRVKVYGVHGEFESVVAGPESFPENAKAGSAEDPSDGTHAALDATVDAKGRIYILDTVTADIRVMARKSNTASRFIHPQSAGV